MNSGYVPKEEKKRKEDVVREKIKIRKSLGNY
jgi:hypothetical protein